VAQALRAERAGVDAVVAQGIEGGGRHAPKSVPLFSLLPHVVDAVGLPVVAAGGIVDSRGVAAALTLGAAAVQLGTRFVATTECPAHPSYKRALLEAGDGATVLTSGTSPSRCLDTVFTRRLRELERSGASPEELQAARPFRGSREAQLAGRLDLGELYCGASAGLIREVLSAGEILERLRVGLLEALPPLEADLLGPCGSARA
jgi:enoyl-[acyl-carrier protein] reductase II